MLTADAWRAEALVAAFGVRGLGGEYNVSRDVEHGLQFVARTDFTDELAPLARRWSPGAIRRSSSIKMTAAALRIWVTASGRPTDSGYLLPLAGSEEVRWSVSGAALAGLGLAGTLIGVRSGEPAYRISSHKRLARLAVLVGEPPLSAPVSDWP